jgi:hypothetical protein
VKHGGNILIPAIVILAAAVLIPIIRHFQLRSETDAYITRLKAEGEPMDLEQVLPPPVSDQQNSANTLIKAFTLMDEDQSLFATNFYGVEMMKEIAPGKAIVCWRQPCDKEWERTNSWQDLTTAIAQNQRVFDLLRQTIGKSDADFGIQYSRGVWDLDFTNLLYLPQSKRATERLSAAVICDLHNGDTVSAVKNLRAFLAIIEALRGERLAISELVRMAIARNATVANWEVLQSPNLTDDELAQLQGDWANLDFTKSAEKALAMERVIGEISLRKWRASNSELERILTTERNAKESLPLSNKESFWDYAKTTPKIVMWRDWWSYPDELDMLKAYDVTLNAMRSAQTNNSFLTAIQYQSNRLNALNMTNSDFTVISDDSDFHHLFSGTVELGTLINRAMAAETAKQITITAIALKRYQLRHGDYPTTLDALVPVFLPAVPLDPVDGKPLCYRPNTDGTYLLYSIGPNGTDDGGNPSLEKDHEGESLYWLNDHDLDWVWPMPATNSETQHSSSPL